MRIQINFQRLCSLLLLLLPALIFGQSGYLDYTQMSTKLKELAKKPNTKLESYGKSHSNKDLWVLKMGNNTNPAILIVAGVDGRHQAGTLAAASIAEKFLSVDSLSNLLSSKTVYIIPNANPDAMDAFFAKTKFEKSGNARSTDDNRNGRIADDVYNDLNGDGVITMIRVETQAGDYVKSDKDGRLMIKADAAKDQKGTHSIITEGIDDNKNGLFNEDPSNGVNIDRNFAFDHPYFKENSGEYAASENEVRSLMDFLAAHTNIHTIINFGPQNSLSTAQTFDPKNALQRIIKGWQQTDVKASEALTASYNKHNVLKNPPTLPLQVGSFVQTAYYHSGKFAYSTPVWWATVSEKKDSSLTEKPASPPMTRGGGAAATDKDPYEITYLKWMDKEGLKENFVDWKEFKHPDFPNHKTEIGGIKPYALFNPPAKYVENQIGGHLAFLNDVIKKMPTHNIVDPIVEKLNDNLYRVTVSITNKGGMPSYSTISDKLRYTSRIKTEIKLASGQNRVSGRKYIIENALQPNEAKTHSWLISGKGQVTIESGCNTTGISKLSLDLK
jgi:hypothetical protein